MKALSFRATNASPIRSIAVFEPSELQLSCHLASCQEFRALPNVVSSRLVSFHFVSCRCFLSARKRTTKTRNTRAKVGYREKRAGRDTYQFRVFRPSFSFSLPNYTLCHGCTRLSKISIRFNSLFDFCPSRQTLDCRVSSLGSVCNRLNDPKIGSRRRVEFVDCKSRQSSAEKRCAFVARSM